MPPLAIVAGIAAVGGVASSVISSNATKKAVNAQTDATNANNALAREQFNINSGNLSPFIERGNQAGGYINSLLGIGGDPTTAAKAFENYRGSTGYQYQLSQGLGAVNSNAYARGMGQSGATYKALQDRGNNIADQSFNNYIANLRGTEQTGLNAANGLAGVSTNYVGQVSNNNNTQASVVGNAALTNASNNIGAIQNLINAGGYAYGSSYGGKSQAAKNAGAFSLPGFG